MHVKDGLYHYTVYHFKIISNVVKCVLFVNKCVNNVSYYNTIHMINFVFLNLKGDYTSCSIRVYLFESFKKHSKIL